LSFFPSNLSPLALWLEAPDVYDKTPTSPDNTGDVSVLRRRAAIQRNRSLDGVRGIAALTVFVCHCIEYEGLSLPVPLATYAVWIFFALSGLVLTRAWDGHCFAFLARRFVRLWPMYALCLGAATLLTASTPGPLPFFWYPLSANLTINPPAWSLVVEAWAMLAMPVFIWFGAGSVMCALMGVAICVLCAQIDRHIVFGSFFIGGAWLSRYDWRLGLLEHPFFQ
jgi:peptidoglycan/LPS O-acetylase OafA/YrhL